MGEAQETPEGQVADAVRGNWVDRLAPAPTRPPDSALFSAPTLILPAGGMVDEEDLDGESEVAAATAAAPDDHLDAPTEEAPREPMTPPTPLGSLDTADRSAPDADVSAVDSGAETLVTANPGCHLQWATGVSRAGREVRVAHIAEVVAEALGEEP